MRKTLVIATLIAIATTPLATADTAEAKQPKRSAGTVTACSKSGFDCYTARVVESRVGRKLVLRGGATIDCGYDCRDTLRVKTVDFWEDRMLNGG